MTESYFGYRILLIVLIVAVNAFFAAAEVSLVSCRRSRLRMRAEEGNAGAKAALSLLENPERLLSVTQVGVTLASLGLGWAGEETLYEIVAGVLQPAVTPASAALFHGLSFGLAFLAMSFVHIVAGEVVPKNLGIEKANQFAILSAPALLVFYRISLPFVYVIERTASSVSRLFGMRGHVHGGGHSAEELRLLVTSSRHAGHLESFQEVTIQHLLDLENVYARQAMVPRNDVVSIPLSATLDETLRIFGDQHYSRYPVYEATPENIVGIVLAKDLLREWAARRRATERRRPTKPFNLRSLLRKPLIIPETKPLGQLLEDFRATRTQMGVVVDEFGTIVGIITMEDVLEQIFGEIEDEFDAAPPAPAIEAREIELDGAVSIRDLEMQYGIELPGDAGFETLAGFLLFRLGYIPSAGESVDYGARKFTVLQKERNRIARVKVERLDDLP